MKAAWLSVCLTLVPPVAAQTPLFQTMLVLRDGTAFQVEVLGATDDSVSARYPSKGQTVNVVFHDAELDPHAFYEIRDRTAGDDAKARLALARFAAGHRMFLEARLQHRRAKQLDAKLIEAFDRDELPALKEELSQRVLADARDAATRKDYKSAKDMIEDLVLYGNTKAAAEAKALATEIADKAAEEMVAKGTRPKKLDSNAVRDVTLKTGKVLRGRVLETTDDGVTLEMTVDGAKATAKITAGQLSPSDFYRLRSESLDDDGAGHLELAKFLAGQKMFGQARLHYAVARSLDPALVAEFEKNELPGLKEGLARRLLGDAQAALKKGKLDEAERDTARILTALSETSAAGEARKMVDQLTAARDQAAEAAAAKRAKERVEGDRAVTEGREKALAPATEAIGKARKLKADGIKEENRSNSIRTLESAAGEYEKALKDLAPLRKQHAQDASWVAELDACEPHARAELVDTYVTIGSLELDRDSRPNAEKRANQALALDPENPGALALKTRIAVSADDDWGAWPRRWRRGGRGR
jgi:hypothetical protein